MHDRHQKRNLRRNTGLTGPPEKDQIPVPRCRLDVRPDSVRQRLSQYPWPHPAWSALPDPDHRSSLFSATTGSVPYRLRSPETPLVFHYTSQRPVCHPQNFRTFPLCGRWYNLHKHRSDLRSDRFPPACPESLYR